VKNPNNPFEGTLEERMDNKTDFNEHGQIDIGPEEVMLERWRTWHEEHIRILTELGITVAGEPEPSDEDVDDISDLNEYDDLIRDAAMPCEFTASRAGTR
jgi:hypothetical protein